MRKNKVQGPLFSSASVCAYTVSEKYTRRVHITATNYLNRGDRALRLSERNSGWHKRMGASSTKLNDRHTGRANALVNIKISSTSAWSVDPKNRHSYYLLHTLVRDIVHHQPVACRAGTDQARRQKGMAHPEGGR